MAFSSFPAEGASFIQGGRTMSSRLLHSREEAYRWAIEKLDEAFGRDQVRVTPRNHYHVIMVAVSIPGSRREDLVLRDPITDLNQRDDREIFLQGWIARTRKSLATRERPIFARQFSSSIVGGASLAGANFHFRN
jgi:hypothetical protein